MPAALSAPLAAYTLGTPSHWTRMDTSATAAIRLFDLKRRFGRVQALDGLSLTVRSGEIYGFLGRNGAGKTTTLRILMGIMNADSGSLEVLGKRVAKISVALKQHIGYVSQEQVFYPWMTARDLGRFVASFYPTWDMAEYERLLRLLDVPPDRRSIELSGGTRTKLGLALALAPRPPLLLLDEPTSGLDPVARREFNDMVKSMVAQRGTTVLLSSHLVEEIQNTAACVGIIQHGRMCIQGPVTELRSRVRRVQATVPLQLSAEFTHVRDDVWQATEAHWHEFAWPEDTVIQMLSLEDIFLAFARTDAVAVAP
jgi:ABC-2 type transport system ATP-binding protein